ncbi:MAG: 16S rRNA (guanine(527)-N(7))-methyltransferase RsmG, partial [Sphingomonadaceae bacterium]
MIREESQRWLKTSLGVSRETMVLLSALEQQVVAANDEQNLIAKSTMANFWSRHIVDSAQLLPLSTDFPGTWLDLGSGAGFPGLIVALLTDRHVVLAEERRKRVEHLRAMVAHFDLSNRVSVLQGRVEQQHCEPFAVISARAFAPLDRLFTMAHHLSSQ